MERVRGDGKIIQLTIANIHGAGACGGGAAFLFTPRRFAIEFGAWRKGEDLGKVRLTTARTTAQCLKVDMARSGDPRNDVILIWKTYQGGSRISCRMAPGAVPGAVHVALSGFGTRREYTVRVETTSPHFGGLRFWFRCPRCQARRRALYAAPRSLLFACRACLGLTYPSQWLDRYERLSRRQDRLWERIGGCVDGPWKRYWPKRPKGMHRKTVLRLRTEWSRLNDEITGECMADFTRLISKFR